MADAKIDVLLVADPRFAGGTSSALATDCRALVALGMKIGLLRVSSSFLETGRNAPSPDVLALLDLPEVRDVAPGSTVTAKAAFFHHPLAFRREVPERAVVRADRAVVVAHHTPFRGDGSLEYDPLAVTRRIRRGFGARVWWAPNSELTRRHLRSFSPLIRLTSENWFNLFDVRRFRAARPAFGAGAPTVGRHGRVDPLKWPDRAEAAAASLPTAEGWRVRIMGCPRPALEARGVDLSRWEVLDFNAEPVRDFLESLDVFSYHFSESLVESFGRTVVEAMLMERPCVLDPRLEATFRGLASFCRPEETAAVLSRLRDDPGAARAAAARAREACVRRYAIDSIGERMSRLLADPGVRSRAGEKEARLLAAARKYVGHHRRALQGMSP